MHAIASIGNDPEDADYRRFLARLAGPLLQRLPSDATGLDYGCGPGPALACMLREAGLQIRLFDPFFAPDPAALDDLYDFITCTETIEHFHHPAEEFARFDRMVRPGGWLAVMTCFVTDEHGKVALQIIFKTSASANEQMTR